MDLKEFIEQHKGVRRSVLVVCICWVSITIITGLWIMLSRALTAPEVTFLTAVIALMQVPIAFYFYYRGLQ